MEFGEIIEYIEHCKIVCAVILKTEKTRLKILAESGREIKLSKDRISHKSTIKLNLSTGKTQLIESVKQISNNRNLIAESIDVKSLWHKLSKTPKWVSLKSITKLHFYGEVDENKEAAIIRAIFKNKLYFQFATNLFYPNTEKKINEINSKLKREKYYNNLIEKGKNWINNIDNHLSNNSYCKKKEIIKILSSFYIYGKTSKYYKIATNILKDTSIDSNKKLFNFMVKIGVWKLDENIDLLRFKIPLFFSKDIIENAKNITSKSIYCPNIKQQLDLTNKKIITIDGSETLDFDDALSIEKDNNNYLVGIHISDVANFIKKKTSIDNIARDRISSIYMPELNIPMMPTILSENKLSFKKNKIRAAISTFVRLDSNGSILEYKIYNSIIKVTKQLNYQYADQIIKKSIELSTLYNLAKKLREQRIKKGATQITLPEIKIQLTKSKNSVLSIKKINRESPSRMLIAEMMILSNWVTAKFLNEHNTPAIFRIQPEPRLNIVKNNPTSLFHNLMQKKALKKLSLNSFAKRHCILGLEAYVTATSPIRKYSDLVTQRQIRKTLGVDIGYNHIEIEEINKLLTDNTTNISKLQSIRKRYWLLKYLEDKIGEKEEALILRKKRQSYIVLIKKYMLECELAQSSGINLKSKDIIEITIQHVNARNNTLSIFMS